MGFPVVYNRASFSEEPAMQLDDVIRGRRSIRGYKRDPVPRALIEEIIGLAIRSPSSMNTQPWNFGSSGLFVGTKRPS